MKLRARFAIAVLLTLCAVAGSGCAPTGTASNTRAHWLRIAIGQGDPNSLNIHLDPSATTGYIAELTQAYLTRYDVNARPVPELVTVIPTQRNGGISADGKTIVWHLRHGVRWSDGEPFSADDVLFSVRTIMNPTNNEEQGTAGWDSIATMAEPDKYTAVFHLKHPYGSYLPLFFWNGGERTVHTAQTHPGLAAEHQHGELQSQTRRNRAVSDRCVEARRRDRTRSEPVLLAR